ncbi:Bile acid:sodium symporter OS=Streptomyces rimosus subsp. rimosus (strain ATCC / DSM 40260 /JCM 4667 / NRRL 2234) OX=1265868 GN=SRIM_005485 PE=4 SV=1 [Streptomyces rimosus subsp. rimosus]
MSKGARARPGRADRLRRAVDPYVAALLGTVLLATVLPASGRGAEAAGSAADLAIGLLFFLYGARLSTRKRCSGCGSGGCTC